MYRKRTYYPKTNRLGKGENTIFLTEKLDGSNLGFAKINGELMVFQRNTVYKASDRKNVKEIIYKGLFEWLDTYEDILNEQLLENAVIFGEWIGMAQIKYPDDFGRYHMFAKANYNAKTDTIINLYYNQDLFIYPFKDQIIPDFIKVVPIVATLEETPTIEVLDDIYEEYRKDKDHEVEGFIIVTNGKSITKYVRHKGGVTRPHFGGEYEKN